MKKIMNRIMCTLFGVAMISAVYGQENTASTTTTAAPIFTQDKSLTDPAMSRRLQTDLGYRNENLKSTQVDWFSSGNGYYGIYSIQNENYMTFYDKDGRYVETLRKGVWGDGVPADLKTSFDKGPYKSREVTGYYTISDPNRTGYYLELQNTQGKMSRVWVDEKGKFSTLPPKSPEMTGSIKK